jgi:DNA-binding transcriptional ArsR family regulator
LIIGELHLKDFPPDTYFRLKDEFRKEFMQKCVLAVGGTCKDLARYLGVPYYTFQHWKTGNDAIPLAILLKLASLLKDWDAFSLEKNVIMYKSRVGKWITNPNLPLIFDERAVLILVHLIADGTAPDGEMPKYCNTNSQLLNETKRCLLMFGDVPVKERKSDGCKIIPIPTIVVRLLRRVFGEVKFGSYEARLPKLLWSAQPIAAAAAVRAFADDEATVQNRGIRFYSANKALLNDIRSLLIDKFSTKVMLNGIPESAISLIVRFRGQSIFCFRISSKGLSPYQKLIGFTHDRKTSELTFWVNKISISNWHNRPRGETRRKILRELQKGPKTVKELSKAVRLKEKVVCSAFLYKLREKGLVSSFAVKGVREKFWNLSNSLEKSGLKIL